jgi:hypothetical protein
MKYAVEIGSGAMIHTKVHKDWFRHSEFDERYTGTQIHRQHGAGIAQSV